MQMADALDRVFPDKSAFGFYCEGRVNVLGAHPELIYRLKRAGLLRLQIGIESGNQDILDRMNKAIRIEQIERVVTTCYEADVPAVFGAFMCGLPGQTMDDLKRDIEFAKHLADLAPGQSELESSIFVPLPGTELQENAAKWGISIFDPQYVGGLITNDCFSETALLSRSQIQHFRDVFRKELQKHCLDQIPSLPMSRVKEFIVMSIERHMVPLVVRLLNRFDHAKWILTLRARQDHRFLHELPAPQWHDCFPLHVVNQARNVGGQYWVNEGSPKAFAMNDREKSFYDHFCGKLTFSRVAECMSRRLGISPDAAWNECLAVYRKCEDNLAAIVMI